MRFLVAPTSEALTRSRPPVRVFVGFGLLLLGAMVAQRAGDHELTPGGVVEHYLGTGAPDEIMPLTALVEGLHGMAFVYGFMVFTVTALLVVTPMSSRLRSVLTAGAALACVVDLAAPFVVTMALGYGWLRVLSLGAVVLFLGGALAVVLLRFGRPIEMQ